MKYIVITGGAVSGIGKGIVTSSIGALLKACERQVTAIKIDPYINIDAGTFSPYEHGEVFVLNDGSEVDLDLGNYERFLETSLCERNNITTGKIYQQVIDKEREGGYLGKTVQIIPHITDAIQNWIEKTAIGTKGLNEICLIELGGTVGDIEGMPFIEALRQLRRRVKPENFCVCHVNLVPCVGPSRELKSKPTQTSVSKLRSLGLYPDMIVCRSEKTITQSVREKISLFCDVEPDQIFSLPDLKTIYMVPKELERQGMISTISKCLKMPNLDIGTRLRKWETICAVAESAKDEVRVAMVGKYTALGDCYTSVVKALEHAGFEFKAKAKIIYIDSALLEDNKLEDNQAWRDLKSSHCLLVPGGFGLRGVEGKIAAIQWARENKLPFLGICLGFQMATVEYARNVLKIHNAHSTEFKSEIKREFEPIIIEMPEYNPDKRMGGSMRLGLKATKFVGDDSIVKKLYNNQDEVEERHRHRFEVNPKYIGALEQAGLMFVGKKDDESRMEIFELNTSMHPFFVGVQYHPEYLTRPFKPSPPYKGLIQAGLDYALETITKQDKPSI